MYFEDENGYFWTQNGLLFDKNNYTEEFGINLKRVLWTIEQDVAKTKYANCAEYWPGVNRLKWIYKQLTGLDIDVVQET